MLELDGVGFHLDSLFVIADYLCGWEQLGGRREKVFSEYLIIVFTSPSPGSLEMCFIITVKFDLFLLLLQLSVGIL